MSVLNVVFTYFWKHKLYSWKVVCVRAALNFILHFTVHLFVSVKASVPICDASYWILDLSLKTETDFCSILKFSLLLPQTKKKDGLLFQLSPSAFLPSSSSPFYAHKSVSLEDGIFFVSVHSRTRISGICSQKFKSISLKNQMLVTVVNVNNVLRSCKE